MSVNGIFGVRTASYNAGINGAQTPNSLHKDRLLAMIAAWLEMWQVCFCNRQGPWKRCKMDALKGRKHNCQERERLCSTVILVSMVTNANAALPYRWR